MYYFIKHDDSSKPFLFQSTEDYAVGDTVICATHRGETMGTVVEFFFSNDALAKTIAAACHAYWPLAKIIRKYTPPVVTSIDEVPQSIINKIRAMERRDILCLINKQIPFDI